MGVKVELGEALLCSPQHQVPLANQRERGLETLTLSTMRGQQFCTAIRRQRGLGAPSLQRVTDSLP